MANGRESETAVPRASVSRSSRVRNDAKGLVTPSGVTLFPPGFRPSALLRDSLLLWTSVLRGARLLMLSLSSFGPWGALARLVARVFLHWDLACKAIVSL